jgi:raffinose/stachyose/melibiose transport system permease protein
VRAVLLRTADRARTGAMGYLLVAPALAVFAIFFLYPVVSAVELSFKDWNGLTPLGDATWVGLDNYSRLLEDEVFREALGNTLIFAAVTTVIQTTIAFWLAFALWHFQPPSASFQRVVIFFPTVLSMVLVGLVWQQLLAGDGPVNRLLGDNVAWLGDPDLALWVIAWLSAWQWTGWSMMLFLAGMVGVRRSLVEAAQIDGARDFRVAVNIVLPALRPVAGLVLLLNVIGAVQAFDTIWVTTRGGPNHATETLTTYAQYTAFDAQGPGDLGYASAIAAVTIVVLMLVAATQLRSGREAAA